MLTTTPKAIYLKDYTPPAYQIDTVALHFCLNDDKTVVTSKLSMRRAEKIAANTPLVLNGEHLVLAAIALDDRQLTAQEYQLDAETLTLCNLPDTFELKITTIIKPQENTALEGLYQSNGNYCTQCEAHGFRRITYFLDRPDVMAVYTTTIEADKQHYPVLLSNGNLIASGKLEQGRHFATWHDPFKKPCYLFALVAGDLAVVTDQFITCSNKTVTLKIFVEKGHEDQCRHAMASLKQAMRWDEAIYGREYDLDIFMIVAVSDFNMGAMENKGLNIFNAKYILAKSDTATDIDYANIEGVVAHEYFHNWTGNRITCRDWFQLSLKEGLTVFRDQEFSADMNSRVVQRINDVRRLRAMQFVEDSGPLAHPVRPESYIEMNNFYTATVYEKGAEVIRMLHTILGAARFRKAMDLYFARHDGQAVTCDDFVKAMEDASGIDLRQFRLWYSQAGTPQIQVSEDYDAKAKTYTLSLTQACPATPGQSLKQPLHIPITAALFASDGQQINLQLAGETESLQERVLNLTQATQQFTFINVPYQPTVSLLRNFSAPVKLNFNRSVEQLIFLMQYDTDQFNRWEASQQLAAKLMLELITDYQQNRTLQLEQRYLTALKQVLTHPELDKALIAEIFALPTEVYLGELLPSIDVEAIVAVRRFVKAQIAQALQEDFLNIYQANQSHEPYVFSAKAAAQRSLKNICLHYLALVADHSNAELVRQQFLTADNMTDEFAAFQTIVHNDHPQRQAAINDFYAKWQHNALVIDKWLTVQATADIAGTLENIKSLVQHPAFNYTNPNKVRSLIGAFGSSNFHRFHDSTGAGYQFIADQVIHLNSLNPQVAARIIEPLTRWQRYDRPRQKLMKCTLEWIVQQPKLSKDVYEIVAKSLD